MLTEQDIIFQNKHYVAINKPHGLLVHPSMLVKHETECAMKQLRDLLGQWVYPVHRLDRATSGVLIFGLTSEAASKLAVKFSNREVRKEYLALVRGFTANEATIAHPLFEIRNRLTGRPKAREKPPQEAVTRYKTIEHIELPIPMAPHPTSRYSTVLAIPETGRQQQIRRHFKHIFHPIIGDPKHGDAKHNRLFAERFACNRLMLHSRLLGFIDPFSGNQETIIAPLDTSFSEVIVRAGFNLEKMLIMQDYAAL
ncbi:MAG: tRNA pseudouridine(65) synthase TruC [Candidatus Rifleibacteriota bacterium]